MFIRLKLDPQPQDGGGSGGDAASAIADSVVGQIGAAEAAQPASPNQQETSGRGLSFNPGDESSASGVADLGGHGGVAAPGNPANAGAATEWESLIDAARGLGYDFAGRQYDDDQSFLREVLTQAQANRQADYYAQLGRQLAPHYQGIQDYLQQNPQGQAATPTAARPAWEAPEWNEQWLALVERDQQSGVFLAKPGVNPVIADKVNEYDRWFKQVGADPVKAIRPYVEQSLPGLIQRQVQDALAQHQQRQQIDQIMTRNAEWMFQRDAAGRQVVGVGGRPVYTPQGTRYSQLVGELERGGMTNPTQVDAMARQLVLGELAQSQLRGTPEPPAQQQRNALASGQGQRNVNQSRSPLERVAAAATTEPSGEGRSLRDLLADAFKQEGYTEADFESMEMLSR